MIKSVQIDDSVHKKLETVHALIKQKHKAKVSYGDIIDRLLDDPEKIAEKFFEKEI